MPITFPQPSFSQRLAAAWKRFRFAGSGGGVYGSTGWGNWFGGWGGSTPGTRYDFARECGPVHLNGVVLSAVNWFALTWSEAPLVVYRPRRRDKPEMLTDHPALDLLKRPNPHYDDTVLWGGSMLSILTSGNGYWVKEFNRGGAVVELNYVPDWQIAPYWPKDGSEFISGYAYRVDGQTIPLDRNRVVQLRWPVPDPFNTRKGLSPLAAELKNIALDNEISNYTATILRNMGIPGVIIAPKDSDTEITPEQAERIKEVYVERFTGDNRGAPFVPSLPIDVHSPGYSPEQMSLGTLVDQPVPRICAALRIDPMVLGYSSPSKTFSNLKQAMEAAYERTLIPLHSCIDSQMTEQIMADVAGARDGDYFGRDYTVVRALAEDEDAVWKRLSVAAGGAWLTVDEVRERQGLSPIEGGDVLRQPTAPTPVAADEEKPALPRAASIPVAELKAEIAGRWRERRAAREGEQLALAGSNGA